MDQWVAGAEPLRYLEFFESIVLESLAFIDSAQVAMCKGNGRLQPDGMFQVRRCFFGTIELHHRIA